jgi:hypothetical protein
MIEMSSKTTLGHFLTKFGIDANVLIDLVLDPKAKDYFKEKGYSFPDKFLCTLNRIVGETKGVLINKYKFTEPEANILKEAQRQEMISLRQAGILKVLDGSIGFEELLEAV